MITNRKIPIYLILLYSCFTILFYIISPWDFHTVNFLLTYFLLILYNYALYKGYDFFYKSFKARGNVLVRSETILRILTVLLAINCIVLYIYMMRSNYLEQFDLQVIVAKLVNPPSENYYAKLEMIDSGKYSNYMGVFGSVLSTLFVFFTYPVLISGIVFFKEIGKWGKIFASINVFLYLLTYLMMGTNKGVMDIVFIILSTLLLHLVKGNIKISKRQIKIACVTVLICGLSYFSFNMGDRYFGKNWKNNYYISNTVTINEDSLLLKIIPDKLQTLVVSLNSYLCQGYYGFSLATDVEWDPMLGIGSSQYQLSKRLKERPEIEKYMLQSKTERKYGWQNGLTWSSLYTSFANDVSIWGVPLVMFALGGLFALSFKDYILKDNKLAAIIFTYLIIEFFYIPANNQISMTAESEYGFIFILFLWLISRKVKIKI